MIWFVRLIGLIGQVLSPGYGACGRCWWPWSVVEGHSTMYGRGGNWRVGCFPLCESCWRRLTPAQRLPYYRALVDRWEYGINGALTTPEREELWGTIRAAVLQEGRV